MKIITSGVWYVAIRQDLKIKSKDSKCWETHILCERIKPCKAWIR